MRKNASYVCASRIIFQTARKFKPQLIVSVSPMQKFNADLGCFPNF